MSHDLWSENHRNFGRVWRLVFTPQTKKKKWRALRPVFLTLGEPFGRQSTSHSLLLQNSIKKMASAPPCISYFGGSLSAGRVPAIRFYSKIQQKNSERSALYFLLRGEPFGRQSTSHSLLLQNSTKQMAGAPSCFSYFLGNISASQVRHHFQSLKPTTHR